MSMLTREETSERSKTIGALLRKARLNAGLDADVCGRALGLPTEQVLAYETGQVDLSLPQLEILSRLFGVPVTFFWSDQGAAVGVQSDLAPAVQLAIRRRMIGVLLRQARLAAGKRLSECAQILGVANEAIAGYEYGREDIPFSMLERLGEFLHVPLSYFADEELVSDSDRDRRALQMLSELPPEVREFVLRPANVLYLRLAMLLSSLSTETLRQLGEGLLDITL